MVEDADRTSGGLVTSPRRIAVGVTAPGISGGGHLYIARGRLVCELGPATRRIAGIASVEHRGDTVHVYRARLVPFWFNVGVRIDDGSVAVRASMWAFGLRSLITTLTEAGFTVEYHRTWVYRGLHYSELVGARRA